MQRELNSQLFGNPGIQGGNPAGPHAANSPQERAPQPFDRPFDPARPAPSILGGGQNTSQAKSHTVAYPAIDVKAIDHQISILKVALIQMEKRSDSLASKIDDLGRGVHARLERFSQAIVRLEEVQSQSHQEATARFAQVSARVNERKVTDNKVQDLIDRHNTIVRNFENRLISLQRLVSEQEMTLHNAQAALEEARAELSKRPR